MQRFGRILLATAVVTGVGLQAGAAHADTGVCLGQTATIVSGSDIDVHPGQVVMVTDSEKHTFHWKEGAVADLAKPVFVCGNAIDMMDYSAAPGKMIGHAPTHAGQGGYAEHLPYTKRLPVGRPVKIKRVTDYFTGINNITGSAYDDHLYGGDAANVLIGMGGVDKILGFGGDDMLVGGGLNNAPAASAKDILDGGTGDNLCAGGKQVNC